jgi:hypothetical protein
LLFGREPVAPLDAEICLKEAAITHVKHLIANQEKAMRKIDSELKALRVEERKIQTELDKTHKVRYWCTIPFVVDMDLGLQHTGSCYQYMAEFRICLVGYFMQET